MDMRSEDVRNYTKLDTRTEFALMTGDVLLLNKESDIKHALEYAASAIGVEKTGDEIVKEALRYSDTSKVEVAGFSTGRVMEFPVINVILRDKDEPFKLDDPDGVLCYVLNATEPDFSELGYCYFEKREDRNAYHRIG